MSPDRHGSGATRIEADLSIKRGENLMRRASTCLAVLGLAAAGPAGRRLGRCRPSSSKRKPSRSPASRTPATSSAPARPLKAEYESKAPNTWARRRRSSASTSTCPRARSCTRAASRRARRRRSNSSARSSARKARRPGRSGQCSASSPSAANESKRPRELSSFFAPGGGFLFFTEGTRRCRWKSSPPATTSTSWAARGFGPELDHQGAARGERARSAVRVGQDDQRQGRLGVQEARQDDLLRHACRRSARKAASR